MSREQKLPPYIRPSGERVDRSNEYRQQGIESAKKLLSEVYGDSETHSIRNPEGIRSGSEQLKLAGESALEAGKPGEAAFLLSVGYVTDFIDAQEQLIKARAKARQERRNYGRVSGKTKDQINYNLQKVLNYNEILKERLDLNPETPLDFVAGQLAASYKIMKTLNGEKPEDGARVLKYVLGAARGMRGELSAEEILGKYEGVEIHYHLTDNPEVRRKLDAAGTDYLLTVSLYGHEFDLPVDVKANRNKTVDDKGRAIPGKLWNQCIEEVDYPNNAARLDPKRLSSKYGPMEDALINQICLQHPGKLEALAAKHGDTIDDVHIY
ncbi:hypothetical protein QQ965_00200 [Candidatus Saccharibacteria bacterium oral taxon 955]